MKSFLNLSPGTYIQEFLWGVYVGESFGILYKKCQNVFQSLCTNVQSCQQSMTFLKSSSFPMVDIARLTNFCQSSGIKTTSCDIKTISFEINCISLISKAVEFHVFSFMHFFYEAFFKVFYTFFYWVFFFFLLIPNNILYVFSQGNFSFPIQAILFTLMTSIFFCMVITHKSKYSAQYFLLSVMPMNPTTYSTSFLGCPIGFCGSYVQN